MDWVLLLAVSWFSRGTRGFAVERSVGVEVCEGEVWRVVVGEGIVKAGMMRAASVERRSGLGWGEGRRGRSVAV